jgi:hypothetical protein
MDYQQLIEKKTIELKPFHPTISKPTTGLSYAPNLTTMPIYTVPLGKAPMGQPMYPPVKKQSSLLDFDCTSERPILTNDSFTDVPSPTQNYSYYTPTNVYYPPMNLPVAKPTFSSVSFQPGAFSGGYIAAPSVPLMKKENYYTKEIRDDYSRTPIIGTMKDSSTEFDDYYETMKEMFFSPEVSELKITHTNDYLWGIHAIYRDPWGKQDKEYYKGNPHTGKKPNGGSNFTTTNIKLAYDDNFVDIRGNGTSIVTGLRFQTLKGKVYAIGRQDSLTENLVPNMTKVVGLGGTHNNFCIESLYFYLV